MRTPGGYEGRRIQRTGGSTFIVSLPKTWVTSRGLVAGDVLLFAPRPDGSLTLYTPEGSTSEPARRSITVSNDMDRDHLFRLLVAEYIAGATLLEVRTPGRMSAETREVVRDFAQHMIGPEILEESAEAVVLQDVVGANPLPLPSVIRRMHHMVRAMHADAMTAFSTHDTAIAQDVQARDWEVDRLHWFVQKQVAVALRDQRHLASLGLTLPECSTLLQASRVLERIADHAVRVAEVTDLVGATPVPRPQVEELVRLSETARRLLDTAVETLFSGDARGANSILDDSERLVQHRRKLLDNFFSRPGRVAVALAYVLESLERTSLYASDLAEIAINHAVERQLLESTSKPVAPRSVARTAASAKDSAVAPPRA
ncbi:MAG: phosphate uptake regulator PhoU [Euryarchaeota archaeon]|nr:phosphate uptake regulator PhoU [Euryarchaeota archaeon]MDE1836448.1 phosphate uptake regulator PhoU [Euryarchaeota archaeon]MDE1879037.1 phosphate uptake regulator PhoU [Euryarchaeota archaeon]MDE2044196.1 phosphate uptake regulator PhoU [Thermoplasmata archaeon]